MDHRAVPCHSPSPAEPPEPAVSATRCHLAATGRDRRAHFAVRHAVFVTEQEFFQGTDRDEHDQEPGVRHVVAWHEGTVAGAVRLYPLREAGIWKGDRLAVLPAFRRQGVGAPLVRFAVTMAAQLGGSRMVAHIQPQNVAFFEHLGWHQVGGEVTFIGRPNQLMTIGLPPREGASSRRAEVNGGRAAAEQLVPQW